MSGFNLFGDVGVTALLGLTNGADILYKMARREAVSQVPVDVCEGPDARYLGFLPEGVAEPVTITSSNAADNATGAGGRVISVQGLDADYNVQSKAYFLNGIVGFTTPDVWARVFRLRLLAAGDIRLANLGDITVKSGAAGTPTMAFMKTGIGRSLQSNFTMPAGHVGVAFAMSGGTNDGQVGELSLSGRVIGESGDQFPFAKAVLVPVDAGINNLPMLFSVPPKADIIGEVNSVSGITDVFMSYSIYVTTQGAIGNVQAHPIFGARPTP